MIRSHTRLLPGAPLWFIALTLILGSLLGALPINAQKKDSQPAAPQATQETWSDFQPQGWVLAVPLTSSVSVSDPAGLQPLTAAYRTSVNGGGAWSDWSTTGLTVTGAVSTTQFLTVTGLSFPDSATDNLLQFQIVNSLAVTLTSQTYTVTVDTVPPTSTITSPLHDQIYRTVSNIAGTAGDVTSGVITVSVSIRDMTTGLYWDGAAWGASEAWLDASGTDSWMLTSNLPSWANGRTYVVRSRARDAVGHVETSGAGISFIIDSLAPPPPIGLAAQPPGWSNSATFTVTWTAPADASGIAAAYYKLDAVPTAPTDGTRVVSSDIIAGIAPAGDAIHFLYVWLEDGVGNVDHNQRAAVSLYVDRTAPGAPGGLTSLPDGWTNQNAFTETWSNPADLSGIVGAYYKLGSSGPISPTDGTFVSTTNTITNIAVPGEGRFNIFVWLVDAAGNVNHQNRNVELDAFWYDPTPPTTTVSLNGPLGGGGWYTGSVTATFTVADLSSGPDVTYFRLDGGTWLTGTQAIVANEGQHTLDYYSTDIAGNQETTRTASIPIDTQPPTTTLQIGSAPGPDGWYTQSVTITFVVTDVGSGPDVTYFRLDGGNWLSGTQYILSAEGQHTLDYYSVDRAGNAETIRSASFKVDRTPPLTAYILDGVMGDEDWFRAAVTVTLVPTDAGSGVASTLYRVDGSAWLTGTTFIVASDGVHTVEFYSVDLINNVESTYPLEIKIDAHPPGAPVALVLTPSTWTPINQFNLQWANPSDLSGIAGAYYKLDAEPTSPTDGIFVAALNSISGITVTTEGTHLIYLWLKDRAGNVDHLSRNVGPPLHYDATPPTTTIALQGTAGENDWFTSAVTFTLTSTDTLSGLRATRFSVNGGAWITATSAVLATSGKHTVEYLAEDVAGNREVTRTATIRIDSEPPSLPVQVITGPTGWTRFNDFYATWESPLDTSGIAGAYYKLGTPPTGPRDGTFITSTGVITGITVPGDGRHDFHIWLRDNAGNTDANRRITVQRAFWYDATPPATTATVTGTAGTNGWYLSALTVTLSVTDATSGVAATWWQLDGGQWSTGISFTVNSEGPHEGSFFSVDAAGNGESVQHLPLRVDRRPPSVTVLPLAAEQPYPNFQVTWVGLDPEPGSGLASYDVQVRDGAGSPWTTWQTGTLADSAVFLGQRGHTYYFRARVRDLAGHQSAYPTAGPFVRTTVQAVANGDFGTGNFANWNTAGILVRSVVPISDGPDGGSTLAARLGGPEYGPSIELPGNVPVGAAIISQTINVPALADVPQPRLSFWYRVLTYDVMYSNTYQKYYDTFDVTIRDSQAATATLVLRDGNPTQSYGTLYDTGWRRAMIDLRPYAGRSITLEFANWNREDNRFNTYTYLDNVQVLNWPAARRFLPLAFVDRSSAHQSLSSTPEARERAR